MGYLRGVSCAQRLALPMGLNGPFLSLYVYIYIYSVYRDTCALGRRNIRRTKRKGKKTADWKRRSLLRFCAAQSLHGGFLATPRDFSYLSTQLISGKRLVYWYQVAYNTSSPPGPPVNRIPRFLSRNRIPPRSIQNLSIHRSFESLREIDSSPPPLIFLFFFSFFLFSIPPRDINRDIDYYIHEM